MHSPGGPLGASSSPPHATRSTKPSEKTVVLRTRTALVFYRAAAFLKGDFNEARRVDLKSIGEPQGEAVAFGPSNTVYLAGEGGGKTLPGTLAVLSCAN